MAASVENDPSATPRARDVRYLGMLPPLSFVDRRNGDAAIYLTTSTFAIGGGLNLGHVQTGTMAQTLGTAAAGSLANGTTTNIGAGFAAASPAGGISTGLGASVGQSNAVSGAASIGNRSAMSSGVSNNIGIGVGGGFTNVLP